MSITGSVRPIVFLSTGGNEMYGKVSLYNGFSADILLTAHYAGPAFTDAFFCDWTNKKECRLTEFIASELKRQAHGDD